MKLLILPRYDSSQAATRVRVLQYLPFLQDSGINCEVFPVLNSKAVFGRTDKIEFIRARFLSYLRIFRRLFKERDQRCLLHIHSELFPFVPFAVEYGYLHLLGLGKFIIELDDAWFHRYDTHKSLLIRLLLGRKIDKLMSKSLLVIAGNQYIASRALSSGAKNVEIIPTVVDVEKYRNFINKDSKESSSKIVVGWIGSPATTKFLLTIKDVIIKITFMKSVRFVAFGADPEQLKELPVQVIPWDEKRELDILNQFDIGIMPLTDSNFERGKCGYKLIQYMASGLPVVASPVGVNKAIVLHNETGFLASNYEEWLEYLSILIGNADLRYRFGQKGLVRCDDLYSLKSNSHKFVSLILNVMNKY